MHFMDVLPAGACAVLPTLIQSRTPQVQSDQPYSQEGDLYPTAGIRRCSEQRGPRALCRGDVRRPWSLLGRSRAIQYRWRAEWRGRDEQWKPRRKDLTARMIAAPLSRGAFSFMVNRLDAVAGPGRFTSPTCTARRCRRQLAVAIAHRRRVISLVELRASAIQCSNYRPVSSPRPSTVYSGPSFWSTLP